MSDLTVGDQPTNPETDRPSSDINVSCHPTGDFSFFAGETKSTDECFSSTFSTQLKITDFWFAPTGAADVDAMGYHRNPGPDPYK